MRNRTPPARSTGGSPAAPTEPFWRDRRGLDLSSAYLLPGRRELEVTFRSGHTYRLAVTSLGVDGRIGYATIGQDPRAVLDALVG